MNLLIEYCLDNWQITLIFIAAVSILPLLLAKLFPNYSLVESIRQVYQIIFTNWINVLLIFVVIYSSSFFSAIITKFTINEALYGAMYLVLGYGLMFWLSFLILIILLDAAFFGINRNSKSTSGKLVAEWILISSPFIYWLIEYNQWTFLAGVVAFGAGQFFRKKRIIKILQRKSAH